VNTHGGLHEDSEEDSGGKGREGKGEGKERKGREGARAREA
jgi:hypothetical protein